MLFGLFEKKVPVYKRKDRETWEQVCRALKEEGIRHISAGHYFSDPVSPNGIGGMLDPRDFGAKGRVDRDMYYVRVRERDREAALAAMRRHGLTSIVED
ncbi:MAG: hypothetical protein ACI4NN_08435 [Pyramidobacter sp.]|jgi:hypothetical protein